MIMLNKCILVVCDTPEQCADMVYGIVSLLQPLKCVSEYYPYLTVFDPEYKNILKKIYDSPKGVIIGVTNPLFLKGLKDIPMI